jgi:hypothetical protein
MNDSYPLTTRNSIRNSLTLNKNKYVVNTVDSLVKSVKNNTYKNNFNY